MTNNKRVKLGYCSVERLQKGDILTLRTATEHVHEHNAPGNLSDGISLAKNPFNGPHWVFIEDAEPQTTYRLEITTSSGSQVRATALGEGKDRDTVWRIQRESEADYSTNRKEPVEWDGTPQSRPDAKHAETMNEGDVRGDKNDLLDGDQ